MDKYTVQPLSAAGLAAKIGRIKRPLSSKATTAILLLPYLLSFFVFIVLPVAIAIALSFTNFDSINFPQFIGLSSYIALLTADSVFMQFVIPNTFIFAVTVGFIGYILAFVMAWMLSQIQKKPRTLLALLLYSPSLTVGVAMAVVWKTFFSGDQSGYLNAGLLQLGLISESVQWLQSPEYLLTIMIVISIWSSMGVGFLAMLSGLLNCDHEIYEAGYIDGIKNRLQEIIYITIPAMKPQMLFGAVMAVVTTFSAGQIGKDLSGTNPTPGYSGQLIVNHIEDFGFIRYEMGYASAVSVLLLLLIYGISKVIFKLLGEKKVKKQPKGGMR